ncbi:hypothetical protein SEA_TWEETY19_59 [Arthrobacter phage Tweety19]|uniref:Lipoprotein n=1 Tax=Arthrobacter phage Tweety19 TaxID=2768133 RepID=A0A7G9W255_9CAUD|nr:hypothetical protein PQE19_gp50 [Arthrobacter phage Tweety19]QNO12718.1 hypothetical protein SEA_TWEETY19_59 [Arthrobacter phage Tweety19]
MHRPALAALIAALLAAVLVLSGCDDGEPAKPTDVAEVSHNSPGGVRPYISPYNGKVGVGIDLGGGLVMSPSGRVGIGF